MPKTGADSKSSAKIAIAKAEKTGHLVNVFDGELGQYGTAEPVAKYSLKSPSKHGSGGGSPGSFVKKKSKPL